MLLRFYSANFITACCLCVMLASGCAEQPDPSFSRLAMYQSLEHQEVVIIEIRKDETSSTSRTLRISLGDDYSQWTQEIFTTAIQTAGENISSKNIKGAWLQPDTLRLCLYGSENDRQAIIVNVADRSHTVIPEDCPTKT